MMGKNQHGQLGTGDRVDKHSPTQVLHDKFVRFVTCGVNHTIACIETRNKQNLLTGVELYGCGCNQENRLPSEVATGSDKFRRLHVPNLPWNIRQLESVKGMLFSMANFAPEQLFENTFNDYKQQSNAAMQRESLNNMTIEEIFIRLQAFNGESVTQTHNLNSQLTLICEMTRRLDSNNLTAQLLNQSLENLRENILKQTSEENSAPKTQYVKQLPNTRLDLSYRTSSSTTQETQTNRTIDSSTTENDDSMNGSQMTMGDNDDQ